MKPAVVALLLLTAAVVPIIPDPYYHRQRIPLLLYIVREIEEAYTGERDPRPRPGVLFGFTELEIGRA